MCVILAIFVDDIKISFVFDIHFRLFMLYCVPHHTISWHYIQMLPLALKLWNNVMKCWHCMLVCCVCHGIWHFGYCCPIQSIWQSHRFSTLDVKCFRRFSVTHLNAVIFIYILHWNGIKSLIQKHGQIHGLGNARPEGFFQLPRNCRSCYSSGKDRLEKFAEPTVGFR